MEMLQAALEYATKYGWAVFPCYPTTKRPITPHGFHDAKKDPGAIRAWWTKHPDAAIGIATGHMSNLLVIDQDIDANKGLDGYMELREWQEENGYFPDTVQAITGRGGVHLYFHHVGNDLGSRNGILDGVDVRGEGGYVIAPPSLHPNGTHYQWETGPDEIQPAEVDDTVRKFLQIGNEPDKKKERFTLPTVIPMGKRNATLYSHACSLQAQGLPDAAIIAAVKETNAALCAVPLPDDEVETLVASALKWQKGELKAISQGMPEWHEPKLSMRLDKDGEPTDSPAQTIANVEEAITFDKDLYGRLRWSELSYSPTVRGNLPWRQFSGTREWSNADDSALRGYLEKHYGLVGKDRIFDGFQNVTNRYHVHPIRDALEMCAEMWDGKLHIADLLPMMLGAEPTPYNTAVMQLLLLAAVARVYQPGIKFDYMPVFVGAQGGGKSTLCRFLALNNDWFLDSFSTFDGDKAAERLRGKWIVEVAELQAMRRAKDSETIKAFITSQYDVYRPPYERRTEQRPRSCVLIGTSNDDAFLVDKTGNRRFLPIRVNVQQPTFDMWADMVATKSIIVQCYGEAMAAYQKANGNLQLTMPRELLETVINTQKEFEEDDPWVGIIQEYLDTLETDRVCSLMLWRECLKHINDEPTVYDIRRIVDIMRNKIKGWEYQKKLRIKGYGVQRCFCRGDDGFVKADDEMALPFD